MRHGIPPHLVQLDPNEGEWVQSQIEQRWHWVPDHCRYASIIDVHNRVYTRGEPPEAGMCLYCKARWRKAHKKAA